LLNNNQPILADTRPLAGDGAGAFLCVGAEVGSQAGGIRTEVVLPRFRGTSVSAASGTGVSARGGYLPTSRIPFEHTTQMLPVQPGSKGPHPAREPDPV
jgi:hypothetical protein